MKYLAVFAGLLVFAGLVLGCKKTSEPVSQPQGQIQGAVVENTAGSPKAEASTAIKEQTTCPVMGGAINKEYSTEYKGKKVYFCCPGCKEPFEKDPEKYISKLPQFN
jgi:YHS domain-containing protein